MKLTVSRCRYATLGLKGLRVVLSQILQADEYGITTFPVAEQVDKTLIPPALLYSDMCFVYCSIGPQLGMHSRATENRKGP